MLFSINIYKYILGLEETYRLTKEGIWKEIKDYRYLNLKNDMYFYSYHEAKAWLETNTYVNESGEIKINTEGTLGIFSNNFLYKIVTHNITELVKTAS